jgi:hypothetical protein
MYMDRANSFGPQRQRCAAINYNACLVWLLGTDITTSQFHLTMTKRLLSALVATGTPRRTAGHKHCSPPRRAPAPAHPARKAVPPPAVAKARAVIDGSAASPLRAMRRTRAPATHRPSLAGAGGDADGFVSNLLRNGFPAARAPQHHKRRVIGDVAAASQNARPAGTKRRVAAAQGDDAANPTRGRKHSADTFAVSSADAGGRPSTAAAGRRFSHRPSGRSESILQ